jgi:hypothetical protein
VGAALTGCSLLQSDDVKLDASSGLYDEARIRYRVDTARLNASQAPRASGAQLVSYQQAGGWPAGWQAAIDIEYPHPQGRPGMALVTLRVEDRPSGKPAVPSDAGSLWRQWWELTREELPVLARKAQYEVWTLDLPRDELSEILDQLRSGGFFEEYAGQLEGSEVTTELDGAQLTRSWRQVPHLDALVERVRAQGKLASTNRRPEGSQPAASVLAYRQIAAEEEGFAVASDAEAAAPGPSAAPPTIVRLPGPAPR